MSDGAAEPGGVAALFEGAAVTFDQHSLIWVRGADAVTFLDGLVSQSVAGAGADLVSRSFLLTPQGKMRAFLWLLGGSADAVGLITQRATQQTVIEDLTRFRFRVNATIEEPEEPVVTLVGPHAAEALAAAGLDHPGSGWVASGSGVVAAVPFVSGGPDRFVLTGTAAGAVAEEVPVVAGGVYETARIALAEPLGNIDFDEGTISHELGPVDEAVDFTKGCYLGQELVARIDSRGRVNQTLRIVKVAGEVALTGALLMAGDREVGTVTSATPLYGGATTVGLARIRHEVEDGATITALIEGSPLEATVSAIGIPE
jgi:folate-binding protein YgfZ